MQLTYAPIKTWPEGWVRGQQAPHWSPFRAGWRDTLEVLSRELTALTADHAQVQLDIAERQVRIDGGLKEGTRVDYHGCILAFETRKFGTLTYSCNEYDISNPRNESWRHNMRAIALGLEALRRVDRYGISKRGQQYAGWAELPSGIAMPAHQMTVEEAASFMAEAAGVPMTRVWVPHNTTARHIEAVFKAAAKQLHPDNGGDAGEFRKLTDARELLLLAIHEERTG